MLLNRSQVMLQAFVVIKCRIRPFTGHKSCYKPSSQSNVGSNHLVTGLYEHIRTNRFSHRNHLSANRLKMGLDQLINCSIGARKHQRTYLGACRNRRVGRLLLGRLVKGKSLGLGHVRRINGLRWFRPPHRNGFRVRSWFLYMVKRFGKPSSVPLENNTIYKGRNFCPNLCIHHPRISLA